MPVKRKILTAPIWPLGSAKKGWRVRGLVVCFLVALTACSPPETEASSAMGALVAHGTLVSATALAERMAQRRPVECDAISLSKRARKWGTYTTTVRTRVIALPGQTPKSVGEEWDLLEPGAQTVLDNTLRVRRDGDGEGLLKELHRFDLERTGGRSREVRWTQNHHFVREDGLPFTQIEASPRAWAQLDDQIRAVERLRSMVPRWKAVSVEGAEHAELRFGLGQRGPVDCGLASDLRDLWSSEIRDGYEVEWGHYTKARSIRGMPTERSLRLGLRLRGDVTRPSAGPLARKRLLVVVEESSVPFEAENVVIPVGDEISVRDASGTFDTTRKVFRRHLIRTIAPEALQLVLLK